MLSRIRSIVRPAAAPAAAGGWRPPAKTAPALLGPAALLSLAAQWWGLIAVAVAGLASALFVVTAPPVTRPMFDDSYISLTFARNLAEHYKLSYDGISWSTGATSPLHVTVLAVLLKLGVEPILASIAVGVAGTALLAASAYLLGWAVFRDRLSAFLAGLAIAFTPYVAMDAGNGLETSLFMSFVALSFAGFLLWPSERGRLTTGLILALAVLTRPEGAFLLPALLVYRWLDRAPGEPLGRFLREAALLLGPGAVALSGQTLYALVLNGTLTGTANAKMSFFQENRWPLQEKIQVAANLLGEFAGPVLPLVALALPVVRRREVLLFALFWVPVIVAYALLFPGGLAHYFFRYQHPSLPLLAVLAGGGAALLLRYALTEQLVVKLLVVAAFVVALVPLEQQYERFRADYKQASMETYRDLEGMVLELNRIIQPNEVLATHDIGAVGFYGRFQVLDLVGLANRKVIEYNQKRRLPAYIEGSSPDYLLVFPSWDLYFIYVFAEEHPERYQRVREFPGGRLRGESYVLYRLIDR